MTKREALNGKPYAGNPHVQFDEGEVASCTAEALLRRVHCRRQPEGRASVCAATSRRGSLLYKGLKSNQFYNSQKQTRKWGGELTALFSLFCAVASTFVANAETFRTNNVEGLVYLLGKYNNQSHIIELEAGDYNLGGTLMRSAGSDGPSHLAAVGLHVKGMGATCEETRLIGSGDGRIFWGNSTLTLENLTLTNGYAKAVDGKDYADRGGAVYGGVNATNCLFIGNKADGYGGAVANGVVARNCRFVNNSCKYGGAAQAGSYYNSLFTGNSATEGGATYNATVLDGCVVSNNTASSKAGGCSMGTCRRCRIYGNEAPYRAGVNNATVYDSRIEFNHATTSEGSAAWGSTLSNCVIYANYGSSASGSCYGGAVGNSTVYDSEIYGNGCEVTSGNSMFGGAHNSILYNCSIHDNWAGYGGGVRESTCHNCHIKDNVAANNGNGANAYKSKLLGCTVEGSGVAGGSAYGTIFTGIGGTVATSGNPNGQGSMNVTTVWSGGLNATNCLFVGNSLPVANSVMFSANQTSENSLVNCTIVSNVIQHMFHNAKTEAGRLLVLNSLFFGNTRWTTTRTDSMDIFGVECSADGLNIERTAYGKANANFTTVTYSAVYKFGDADGVCVATVGETPRFCFDADVKNPYSLQRRSKIRGLGLYQTWMANANDIRGAGFSRANGTSVDLGCYQCWIPDVGFILSFR